MTKIKVTTHIFYGKIKHMTKLVMLMKSPLKLRNLLTFKTLIYINGLKTLKVNIFPFKKMKVRVQKFSASESSPGI